MLGHYHIFHKDTIQVTPFGRCIDKYRYDKRKVRKKSADNNMKAHTRTRSYCNTHCKLIANAQVTFINNRFIEGSDMKHNVRTSIFYYAIV